VGLQQGNGQIFPSFAKLAYQQSHPLYLLDKAIGSVLERVLSRSVDPFKIFYPTRLLRLLCVSRILKASVLGFLSL